jgi:phospholipase C
MPEPGAAFRKIEHFFVLMLENRSFDHMFGAVRGPRHDPLTGTEECSTDPEMPHGTSARVRRLECVKTPVT